MKGSYSEKEVAKNASFGLEEIKEKERKIIRLFNHALQHRCISG